MGKYLCETKKSTYEAIYQKFHPRIHVLEIFYTSFNTPDWF